MDEEEKCCNYFINHVLSQTNFSHNQQKYSAARYNEVEETQHEYQAFSILKIQMKFSLVSFAGMFLWSTFMYHSVFPMMFRKYLFYLLSQPQLNHNNKNNNNNKKDNNNNRYISAITDPISTKL